ncbi:MAG: HEPN domain-containing protein [Methanophagales archaeon]|nr:HEPN domain-containing protein [Methanophagales archaeon]
MEKFRDFAIKYLKIAEKDFERAKRNLDFDDYEATIFYAQQCVEKSVKSILEIHGIFTKEHEISTQFAFLAKKEKFDENCSRKILTALEFFTLDWSRTRYPFIFKGEVTSPEEYYVEEKAEQALEIAEEILNLVKGYLDHLTAIK